MNGLRQRPTATLWGTSPPVSSCSAGAFLRSALWSVGFRCARGSILSPSGGRPRELLVMGGGLGLIPHADTLLSALVATPNLHVTVITGKNEALRRELQQAYPFLYRAWIHGPSGGVHGQSRFVAHQSRRHYHL